MSSTDRYIGGELEIFKEAVTWKAYFGAMIKPYLRGAVLEVGAGMGAATRAFAAFPCESWSCLEPDPLLAELLRSEAAAVRPGCEVVIGTLGALSPERRFDTILYIDVLEHIESDAEELRSAAERLRSGGHIIALSPAHQFLFSEFDRSIGHFRRYDADSLRRIAPPGTEAVMMRYLDCVGMSLSLANRVLLKSPLPKLGQILFWDRRVVPISRLLDPLLGYKLGKSILAVWRKT